MSVTALEMRGEEKAPLAVPGPHAADCVLYQLDIWMWADGKGGYPFENVEDVVGGHA